MRKEVLSKSSCNLPNDYISVDSIPIPFQSLDKKGRIIYVNHEWEKLFGLKYSEITGKSLFPLLSSKDRIRARIDLFAVKNSKNDKSYVYEVKGYDIERRIVDFNCMLDSQKDKNSKINCFLKDITADYDAKYAENLFSYVANNTSEIFIITDSNGNLLYANPTFQKVSGYLVNEVIGRNIRFLKSGKQDSEFYRQMWRDISSGKVWEGEIINKKKSGKFYTEYMTIIPIKSEKGKIENYLSIKSDITNRKSAEGTLKEKIDSLELFKDTAINRILDMKKLELENETLKLKLKKLEARLEARRK